MGILSVLLTIFLTFADDLSIVTADIPTGRYYDCAVHTPATNANAETIGAAKEACLNTVWCYWENTTTNPNTCGYDFCLKSLAKDATPYTCPSDTGLNCGVYYITDKHNCGTATNPGTGEQTDFDDVYCRVNDTNKQKIPLDKCFYDDLKSRVENSGGSGVCGSKPCAFGGGSSTTQSPGRYCRATDAQICADVISDIGSFCQCLGETDGGKFCELHPNCLLNGTQGCVEDQCTRGRAVAAGPCSFPGGTPGIPISECEARNEYRIDTEVTPPTVSLGFYCGNKNKNKNANTCFWGLDAKTTKWQTPAHPNPDASDGIWPDCQSTAVIDKCTDLTFFNYSTYPGAQQNPPVPCEVATIPGGWFPGTQICINNGREVPVDTGFSIRAPFLLAVLILCHLISFSKSPLGRF